VHEVPDRRGGSYLIHGYPWRFSDDELGMRSAPAFRGEHNEQVFRGAGLSEGEVRRAIDAGILVGGPPPSAKQIDAAVIAEARAN
jgi:crotonobetainyl-CoA:carnitine CoA-transferase CaiB-like acyl-CoA transferase